MSKKTVTFAAAGALLVGLGVGSAGQATAEPQIRTVTKTVTEEVTPQGCLDALEAGEQIMAVEVPKLTDVTIGFIDLVQEAAYAGLNADVVGIEQVTADMTDLTDDTEGITRRVKPLIRDFQVGRDSCEAS